MIMVHLLYVVCFGKKHTGVLESGLVFMQESRLHTHTGVLASAPARLPDHNLICVSYLFSLPDEQGVTCLKRQSHLASILP